MRVKGGPDEDYRKQIPFLDEILPFFSHRPVNLLDICHLKIVMKERVFIPYRPDIEKILVDETVACLMA
jgi:hypothetical protein